MSDQLPPNIKKTSVDGGDTSPPVPGRERSSSSLITTERSFEVISNPAEFTSAVKHGDLSRVMSPKQRMERDSDISDSEPINDRSSRSSRRARSGERALAREPLMRWNKNDLCDKVLENQNEVEKLRSRVQSGTSLLNATESAYTTAKQVIDNLEKDVPKYRETISRLEVDARTFEYNFNQEVQARRHLSAEFDQRVADVTKEQQTTNQRLQNVNERLELSCDELVEEVRILQTRVVELENQIEFKSVVDDDVSPSRRLLSESLKQQLVELSQAHSDGLSKIESLDQQLLGLTNDVDEWTKAAQYWENSFLSVQQLLSEYENQESTQDQEPEQPHDIPIQFENEVQLDEADVGVGAFTPSRDQPNSSDMSVLDTPQIKIKFKFF